MVISWFDGRGGLVGRLLSPYNATILVIAFLCVVVVGHDLLRTSEDRNRQLENTRREVTNLAWGADQHAEAALRLADATLTELVERVESDGAGPERHERLRRLMARQQTSGPVLLSLTFIDENGDLVVDGGPVPRQATYTDRLYFQYHRTHADRQMHVGGLLRSRLKDTWVVALSRRIDHADGTFGGVVTAAIDVAYFQSFYATFDLGHDGSAGLFLDDGTVLIRQPIVASMDGAKVPILQPFHYPDPRPSGTFEWKSPVDGIARIYAWRRVSGYPLVVGLALGGDEQLAVWRTGAAEHLLATVAITVLLAFIGVRLVAQVRRLTRAEQATVAATSAARTAAAQYRLIADNASDLIMTLDMRFIRRYVSPGCRELVGYEPEELIGGDPLSLTYPDDVAHVGDLVREMIAGRDRALLTTRLRHRDGHWVWVEVSMRLIRDPASGAPLEICTSARDITQRMAAEAALRGSELELERSNSDLRELKVLNTASQYARSLLEASLDPMVTISPEGTITDVNEATIQLTGISRDNLVGTDFSDYFTEPERAREAYRRVFANGSVRDYPLTILHRNETLTEVVYNASVYKDAKGFVLGVFAAARDVTAQMRVEAEITERRAVEHERLEELERFQRLTIGRELKMIELKKEIRELKSP
jgi:PAS domain S-box-containing protein